MWRSAIHLVAVGMVAAVGSHAVSVTAAEMQGRPAASQSTAEQMFADYQNAMFAERFGDALSIATGIPVDQDNREGRALVDVMRASALLGLKRETEAQKLIAESDQLAPQTPEPSSVLFLGTLQAKRFDMAANTLDRMLARYPDAVRAIDWNLMRFFLANEPGGQQQRNEDRRVDLARIGYGGDTAIGHWRAVDAVNILIRRGDSASAGELLGYVNEPEPFQDMLVQKRFAALWPKLEELGGPHLDRVRAASVRSAEQAYLAAPDDMEKLQVYVDALRHAGRINDAIALKSKLPASPQAMAAVDEPTGWVVNSIAYALDRAGRGDEADQLFAALNEPARTHAGWRVSMIINRLELLTLAGKFGKAATLTDAAELSAKNDGNAYAQQLVRRLRYCILSSTGRKDEAARLLPDLLKHSEDALQPTVDGLLCAGEMAKAEELVLRALNAADQDMRETFEKNFVRALQPVALLNDDPSLWDNSWKALRNRPKIAAAYARLGRDMPASLLPEPTN